MTAVPATTQRVRAIVFDIGGVLEFSDVHLNPRWEPLRVALRASGHAHGGSPSERDIECRMADVFGVDESSAAELMRQLWDDYLGEPNVDLIAYFRNLRPAYRTALLSNSMDGARRQEQARYGFADMTDLIVYSHEEGIEKPDPRIYRITCDRLGVSPHETLFVDDYEPNIAAARDLGMRTVLCRDTDQTIADIEELCQQGLHRS